MKTSLVRFLGAVIFAVITLTGCYSRGSEFLGTWINVKNAEDTFQIVRNGDPFLIVSKDKKVGASYEKGMLEIKGMLGSTELTYDRKSRTIVAPGFFGQVEYKRTK